MQNSGFRPSTAMRYSVPATASKNTAPGSPSPATSTSLSSDAPVYTPTTVANPLPLVSSRVTAECGAVHRYHTEAKPGVKK